MAVAARTFPSVNLPDALIDNPLVASRADDARWAGGDAYKIDSGERAVAAYRLAFLKSSPPVISGMHYVSGNPRCMYTRSRARARACLQIVRQILYNDVA